MTEVEKSEISNGARSQVAITAALGGITRTNRASFCTTKEFLAPVLATKVRMVEQSRHQQERNKRDALLRAPEYRGDKIYFRVIIIKLILYT